MHDRYDKEIVMMLITILALASIAVAGDKSFAGPPSIFTDKKAFHQYDVVTVLLMEYTSGSNEATTDSDTRHTLKAENSATGVLDFIPSLGLNSGVDSEQRARGNTSRKGSLRGKMSARIVEILPNGNLQIEGRRTVEINGEEQLTILTGTVRPSDIKADNTIFSYLIADASISYSGNGTVDDAAKPGVLSRFVNWLF